MNGKLILGMELGSTRIKSVLINENAEILASGSYVWENTRENGYWIYAEEDIEIGVKKSFAALARDYREKYDKELTCVTAIGVSAMMHGYIALDENGKFLTPFRTWRNTTTKAAADELTKEFEFNIPQRWSVAHYYQAVLNGEEHVRKTAFLTTLAGYVHFRLTGEKVIGIGDASGMFPVDGKGYDAELIKKFNALSSKNGGCGDFEKLLPKPLKAGVCAGVLTESGARFLDESERLRSGCVLCPPEGDAGTGMTATNSVEKCTANVSAGTSAFLMIVAQKPFNAFNREIDIVATPHGLPVAMVHANNCTNEINAWTKIFGEAAAIASGKQIDRNELIARLFEESENSSENLGGLLGYNFLSGEPIARADGGRPLIMREAGFSPTLADFMKMQLYSAVAALRLGVEIAEKEGVKADCVCGHGGFFKTDRVGQSVMAAALKAPVSVMKTAGEGGAFGMALLALFALCCETDLPTFLSGIFENAEKTVVAPSVKEQKSFDMFMKKYKAGLETARTAAKIG